MAKPSGFAGQLRRHHSFDDKCAGEYVEANEQRHQEDQLSRTAIIDLAMGSSVCFNDAAMVAHDEPVNSRSLWLCGRLILPTTTCVSAGGGCAPRPPGTGRGNPEVQTLRNFAFRLAYGRRQILAGVAERKATNELRPSHAAASAPRPLAMAPSDEGNHCGRTGGFVGEKYISRMIDDLGTARQ